MYCESGLKKDLIVVLFISLLSNLSVFDRFVYNYTYLYDGKHFYISTKLNRLASRNFVNETSQIAQRCREKKSDDGRSDISLDD